MTDLQKIQTIEKQLGIKLNKVEYHELKTKNIFYTVDEKQYSKDYVESDAFPYKGTTNYSTDEKENITGLSLDFCKLNLLSDPRIILFDNVKFLSLKKSQLKDYSFLKELKSLTSLDLRNNKISDF